MTWGGGTQRVPLAADDHAYLASLKVSAPKPRPFSAGGSGHRGVKQRTFNWDAAVEQVRLENKHKQYV
eukprot:9328756-Pyramimonas_sp.AAC.1